jgi:YD repeat-containing protein
MKIKTASVRRAREQWRYVTAQWRRSGESGQAYAGKLGVLETTLRCVIPCDIIRLRRRDVLLSFDGDSNVTSLTTPSTNEHQMSYTPVDELSLYSPPSPATGTWSTQYGYDLDHRPQTETRPDGVVITRAYDRLRAS